MKPYWSSIRRIWPARASRKNWPGLTGISGTGLFTPAPSCSREKEDLLETVAEDVTVLAGPSGVGKSSLINMINPAFRLKTGEVSEKSGVGGIPPAGWSCFPLQERALSLTPRVFPVWIWILLTGPAG